MRITYVMQGQTVGSILFCLRLRVPTLMPSYSRVFAVFVSECACPKRESPQLTRTRTHTDVWYAFDCRSSCIHEFPFKPKIYLVFLFCRLDKHPNNAYSTMMFDSVACVHAPLRRVCRHTRVHTLCRATKIEMMVIAASTIFHSISSFRCGPNLTEWKIKYLILVVLCECMCHFVSCFPPRPTTEKNKEKKN